MSEEINETESSYIRPKKKAKLSKSTIADIERKRQNAILLRDSRIQNQIVRDCVRAEGKEQNSSSEPAPKTGRDVAGCDLSELDNPVKCRECNIQCNASYLYTKFEETVCDECREKDRDQFKLISKTDAKNEFILKDCDFDYREPHLKYVSAPNPHRPHGASMKLYLIGHVYQRACEVHGGDEGIDAAVAKRSENREKSTQRKMEKKMIELRKAARQRTPRQAHVHVFGEERYDEEEDEYSHTCTDCGHVETYEKM
eukprot:sb/3468577/